MPMSRERCNEPSRAAQVVLEMLVYAILIDEQRRTWEDVKPVGRAISELLRFRGQFR